MGGVRWGISREEAKAVLLQRPNVKLESETPTQLVFTGGDCAAVPVKSWTLQFVSDKFANGIVVVQGDDGKKLYETTKTWFRPNYGNGREQKADHHVEIRWIFKDAATSASQGEVKIMWYFDQNEVTIKFIHQHA